MKQSKTSWFNIEIMEKCGEHQKALDANEDFNKLMHIFAMK